MGQSAAHDQYADEQLQNMQKRICLIEFLRLCFVIVYQGGWQIKNYIQGIKILNRPFYGRF